MKWLEELFEKGFYTMAFLRTLVCVIFLIFSLCSCGTMENVYSEAYWFNHQLHFQERVDMPNCHWCIEYNKQIP